MNTPCNEHSGVCARMENAEKNIDNLWKHVNTIRGWFIAGMGSMLMYFMTVGVSFVLDRIK